jgi:hypothetical protein
VPTEDMSFSLGFSVCKDGSREIYDARKLQFKESDDVRVERIQHKSALELLLNVFQT